MTELQSMIEGCQKGLAQWQKALYDKFNASIYALCLRYSSGSAQAQDLLVEGFTIAFNKIADYRGEGSFEGWLRSIFLRLAIRQFKDKQLTCSNDIEQLSEVSGQDSVWQSPSVDLDLRIDLKEAMRIVLAQLPDQQRLIFNLKAVEGYSLSEIADQTGSTESSVKYHYYEALEVVRKKMKGFLE